LTRLAVTDDTAVTGDVMRYPRRRDESDNEHDLPCLESRSDDDEIFLRSMLALAETGDMVRGKYAEAHVARLLGADFPAYGTSRWDLQVPDDPPILVQVKSTRERGFDLKKFFNHDGTVWVFVKVNREKGTRPSDYEYVVAGPTERKELEGQLGKTVAWNKLFALEYLRVSAEDLLSEVRRRSRSR
jgi:hypothetical protein